MYDQFSPSSKSAKRASDGGSARTTPRRLITQTYAEARTMLTGMAFAVFTGFVLSQTLNLWSASAWVAGTTTLQGMVLMLGLRGLNGNLAIAQRPNRPCK